MKTLNMIDVTPTKKTAEYTGLNVPHFHVEVGHDPQAPTPIKVGASNVLALRSCALEKASRCARPRQANQTNTAKEVNYSPRGLPTAQMENPSFAHTA